jgi:hypothetical protein
MISYSMKTRWQLAVAVLPLLGAPALAAQPESQMVVSTLGLSGHQIPNSELRDIRGGFDVSPSLSFSFAYQQITSVDGVVVQSILVPQTVLNPSGNRSSTTSFLAANNQGTHAINPVNGDIINLTSKANNGQTIINTVLGGSGITNHVMNQANNTTVNTSTTLDIGISGMNQFLAQGQSFTNAQSGLYYSGSAFR